MSTQGDSALHQMLLTEAASSPLRLLQCQPQGTPHLPTLLALANVLPDNLASRQPPGAPRPFRLQGDG